MNKTKSFLHAVLCPFILACAITGSPAYAGLFSSAAEDAEEMEQYKTALQLEIDALQRTQNVLFPLIKAATPLCGNDAAWSYGLGFAGRDRFKGDLKSAAQLLGYDKQVGVLYSADTSPAGQAGLRAGDVVVSIDGEKVDEDTDAYEDAERKIARQAEKGNPVLLEVRRHGKPLQFSLQPVKVCDYKLQIVRNSISNAATTGWTIYVTTGLLDFTQDDAELAAVLSHEIAHSLMSHVKKKIGNLALGMVVDTALQTVAGPIGGLVVLALKPGERIGGRAHSQGFELEADYVGLYIMALAGNETDGTAMLWRRFAAEYPQFIQGSYWGTHPSSPERMLLLEETSREINTKTHSGAPLLPDLESRLASWSKGDQ